MDHIVMEILMFVVTGFATPLVVGISLHRYEKKNDKQYEEVNSRSKLRQHEGQLSMRMQMATASLAYSSAIALKRGHANGEVEAAIEEYDEARKAYFDFINNEHVVYMDENK